MLRSMFIPIGTAGPNGAPAPQRAPQRFAT